MSKDENFFLFILTLKVLTQTPKMRKVDDENGKVFEFAVDDSTTPSHAKLNGKKKRKSYGNSEKVIKICSQAH